MRSGGAFHVKCYICNYWFYMQTLQVSLRVVEALCIQEYIDAIIHICNAFWKISL